MVLIWVTAITTGSKKERTGEMAPTFWRDVDSDRRAFGIKFYVQGGQLHLGRKMYRWRWYV
jgi:hypothetical protein